MGSAPLMGSPTRQRRNCLQKLIHSQICAVLLMGPSGPPLGGGVLSYLLPPNPCPPHRPTPQPLKSIVASLLQLEPLAYGPIFSHCLKQVEGRMWWHTSVSSPSTASWELGGGDKRSTTSSQASWSGSHCTAEVRETLPHQGGGENLKVAL